MEIVVFIRLGIPISVIPVGRDYLLRILRCIGHGIGEVKVAVVLIEAYVHNARGDDHQAVEAALVDALPAVIVGEFALAQLVVRLAVVADDPRILRHVTFHVEIAEGASRPNRTEERGVGVQYDGDIIVRAAEGISRKYARIDGARGIIRAVSADGAVRLDDKVAYPGAFAHSAEEPCVTRVDDDVRGEGNGVLIAAEAADKVALDIAVKACARLHFHFAADGLIDAVFKVRSRDDKVVSELILDTAIVPAETHVLRYHQEVVHGGNIFIDDDAQHIVACHLGRRSTAVYASLAHRPTIEAGSNVRDGLDHILLGRRIVDKAVEGAVDLRRIEEDGAVRRDGHAERTLIEGIGLQGVVFKVYTAHHAHLSAHAVQLVECGIRLALLPTHRLGNGGILLQNEPAVVDGVVVEDRTVLGELARPAYDAAR